MLALTTAFAGLAVVVSTLGVVVAGPLTLEAQPNVVPSPSASPQAPVPVPAITAPSPSPGTDTEVFNAPDITVVAPPPPPKKGVRQTTSTGGSPYLGMTAAQYCALKLPAFATSGSDPTAFLYAANKERAQTGAPALTWNSTLATYAQGWSGTMASRQNSHPEWRFDNPVGIAAWTASSPNPPPGWRSLVPDPNAVFVHSFGSYAENIAFNYGEPNPVNKAQSGWMGSTGHCLNIMNPSYSQMGAGKAQAEDGSWFFTEEFTW